MYIVCWKCQEQSSICWPRSANSRYVVNQNRKWKYSSRNFFLLKQHFIQTAGVEQHKKPRKRHFHKERMSEGCGENGSHICNILLWNFVPYFQYVFCGVFNQRQPSWLWYSNTWSLVGSTEVRPCWREYVIRVGFKSIKLHLLPVSSFSVSCLQGSMPALSFLLLLPCCHACLLLPCLLAAMDSWPALEPWNRKLN